VATKPTAAEFHNGRLAGIRSRAASNARRADCSARGASALIVNIRRGIVAPKVLIETNGVTELHAVTADAHKLAIGAAVTLTELAAHPEVVRHYPPLAQAAAHIAGPTQRNMGTVGGNLCLDTRCIFYNQSEWWRTRTVIV
jgi:4-hydroxybenzoyl-CoA reductase subunit beta